MQKETYTHSKSKMREKRLREASANLPGIIIMAFFVGLYFENSIAKQTADVFLAHWNWVIVAVLMVGLIRESCHGKK